MLCLRIMLLIISDHQVTAEQQPSINMTVKLFFSPVAQHKSQEHQVVVIKFNHGENCQVPNLLQVILQVSLKYTLFL